MKKQTPILFMLLLLAALTLSACGVAGAIEPTQAMPEAEEPASAESAAADEQSVVSDVPVASSTPEEIPAATQADPTPTEAVVETVVEAAPTPRADLYATPPGEVALASGELQLVEFFAYW